MSIDHPGCSICTLTGLTQNLPSTALPTHSICVDFSPKRVQRTPPTPKNTDLGRAGPYAGDVVVVGGPGRLRRLRRADRWRGLPVLRQVYGDGGARRTPEGDSLVVASRPLVGPQRP